MVRISCRLRKEVDMSSDLLAELEERGADIERVAARVIREPDWIPGLLSGLRLPRARPRYACEKVLRRVSEQAPALVYPYFEEIAAHLEDRNSFIKWGAILTLANLVAVDAEGRFDRLFDRYFAPVYGPEMITAGNIIGSAPRIARARPELTQRIVALLLRVDTASYVHHGAVSEECGRVVCGHAIDAFAAMAPQIEELAPVVAFVRRQLDSPRPQVRKKAKRFLEGYVSVY
jgi:hypothetical protein